MSEELWKAIRSGELSGAETVEALNQESDDALNRGDYVRVFELDESIRELLHTMPRDQGHGYYRSDEWFDQKFAQLELRETTARREASWSAFFFDESLPPDTPSEDDPGELPAAQDTVEQLSRRPPTSAARVDSRHASPDARMMDSSPITVVAREQDLLNALSASPTSHAIGVSGPGSHHVNDTLVRYDTKTQDDATMDPASSEPEKSLVPAVMTSSASAFGGLPLQAAHTAGDKADLWFQQLSQTHDLIVGANGKFINGAASIKVAVLDSGLAYNTAKEIRNLSSFRSRIVTGQSFVTGSTSWDHDEYGHGTAVAALIATTAPYAEIYVAKVMKFDKEANQYFADEAAVEQAVTHATHEWNVDIINMSFGWDHEVRKVYDALEDAMGRTVDKKKQPVLAFAATSNYGLGPIAHMLWPADSTLVICVDAADGKGTEWDDNPKAKMNKLRFTALGVDVASHYPLHLQPPGTPSGTQVRQTGTSFASAVASGIAALVLEFANQEPCSWVPEILDSLRRRDIMRRVFLKLSDTKNVEEFHFLYPWVFFHGSRADRYGGDATPGSARWDAAYDLARLLDGVFATQMAQQLYLRYAARHSSQKPTVP